MSGYAHPNLLCVPVISARFLENPFRCSASNARISLSFDHGGWAYIPLSDASFLGHWTRVLVGGSLGRSYLLCKRDGGRRRGCGRVKPGEGIDLSSSSLLVLLSLLLPLST